MTKGKILFLSPYPLDKAPSQRLKYEQYYDHFRAAGYELTTSSFVSERFWKIIYGRGNYVAKVLFTLLGYARRVKDLIRLRNYDIVYVHLWVTPIGPSFFEWLVIHLSKKVVYDIDDLVYLNDQRKQNKIMLWIRGKHKPIALMRSADHVICCTPRLEAFVKRYNERVTDISSTINTKEYRPKTTYASQNPIVIGWSGSHSTSRYLHLLQEAFLEVRSKYPFILKVIGDAEFEMEGIDVQAQAWNADNEVKELSEFDIGVYPLPLDEEWVHGKSGLKALQYMALGIPTVASSIGANYRIIDHQKSGFLVLDKDQWVESLLSLMKDEQLRETIGKAGVAVVEQKFSVEVNANTYLGIFKNL